MTSIDDALAWAQAQIGQPYLYGGEGNGGFDCSGLTQMAFRAGGVALPRTAQAQFDATQRVSVPAPGDLVFYGTSPTDISHVGIYLGAGKMLDAPHTGAQVRVENVWSGVQGYGRPITGAGATDSATATLVDKVAGGSSSGSSSSGWRGTLARMGVESVVFAGGVALVGLGVFKGTTAGRRLRQTVNGPVLPAQEVAGAGAGKSKTSGGAAAGGKSIAAELPEVAAL